MEMNFRETEVWGFEHSMRGMRNATNSASQSDSGICKGGDNGIGCDNCAFEGRCGHYYNYSYQIGKNDLKLAQSLIQSGSLYASFLKMIHVSVDVYMPGYWWPESVARTWDTNYEKLRNMYVKEAGFKRKGDWNNAFYDWIKTLPYSKELIMYQEVSKNGNY